MIPRIPRILRKLRERKARKRLDQIVRQTRESFACQDYRRRRAAALKGQGKGTAL